jgi:hypothetical protein
MKGKPNYTNSQMAAEGLKRTDNGEIEHAAEKTARSRKNDNVKPDVLSNK